MGNYGWWCYTLCRFFFALIAIYQANRVLLKYNIKPFLYCSFFLSLTLLSHLEWGITSLVTVSLLILYKQLNKHGLTLLIILVFIVIIMTSPWWFIVISRHGLAPFTAASKTSEWQPLTLASLASIFKIFDDGLGLPISSLAIIGWLISFARKDWFLPVWLIAIFLTTPRHGPTPATMPLSILASLGLSQVLMPIFVQVSVLSRNMINNLRGISTRKRIFSQPLPTSHIVISCIITVSFMLLMTKINYSQHTPLVALTASERSAMTWLKEHTDSESEFVVLTKSISWQDDRVAEWFPVLSERKSLTTAQGLEWMSGDIFQSEIEKIQELKRSQASDEKGLAGYINSHFDFFQYIVVFIPNIDPKYGSFVESGYPIVYNNGSVLVFKKVGARSRPVSF